VCELEFEPKVFVNDGEKSREQIDFIITLGGDGTILWASKQFRK
jgi:NAD kinase